MAGVKVIANDTEFQPELSAAGSRLAVVKFTMRGCGPCLRIAPAFNALSNKYPQATFLEVDVHQCQGTAATNNISATPTFLFFRNKVRIDQYQGADAVGLEDKIKQHLENDPGNSEDTDIPKGYLFVQSNHGDEETTRITYFTFIGTPVQATNMNDFKR
ncbi:hypothetical protein EK904_005037, partial [Melospiza melodia maxima]